MNALETVQSGALFPEEMAGTLSCIHVSILRNALGVASLVALIVCAKEITYWPTELELPKDSRFKMAYCNFSMVSFTLLCLAVTVYALQM